VVIEEPDVDLKMMGIRNWNLVARDLRERMRTVVLLEAKAHNGV